MGVAPFIFVESTVRICVCIHIRTYTYTYINTLYIHAYMCVSISTYTYIFLHTYICIIHDTHMQTQTMVKELLPGYPAAKSGQIRVGDVLLAVHGSLVDE